MERDIDRLSGAAPVVMWSGYCGEARVKRQRSQFSRVTGYSPRDGVRSSVSWEELRVQPPFLCVERSQQRWLEHLFHIPQDTSLGMSHQRRPQGRLRTYTSTLEYSWKSKRESLGWGKSGHLCLHCCPHHSSAMTANIWTWKSQTKIQGGAIRSQSNPNTSAANVREGRNLAAWVIRNSQPCMVWLTLLWGEL